jgi:hypothetical protein
MFDAKIVPEIGSGTLMQIMVNKRRLTWVAVAVFACSLVWLFVAQPYAHPQIQMWKPTKSDLLMGPVSILLGIGVQRWTRGSPQYEHLEPWAYFGTLLMINSLIICILVVFVVKP